MFFLTVLSFSIFSCKNYNQSDFGIDHLVMSMCRVIERECFLGPAHSLQKNSVILCLASFYTPRPKFPITPGISWLATFAFQSAMMTRASFLVLALEALVVLHRTIQFHHLCHQWSLNNYHITVLFFLFYVLSQITTDVLDLQKSTYNFSTLQKSESDMCSIEVALQILKFGLFQGSDTMLDSSSEP